MTIFSDGESGLSVRTKINSAISTVDGLGTASAADTGDFATAAQGAKADTAVQPGSLATVATTGAYGDLTGLPSLFDGAYASLTGKPTLFDGAYASLTGKPTLGTAAAAATGDFATAVQGGKADTAVQPGALSTVATTGAYADITGKPTIPTVSDAVYGAGWNGNTDAPSKNAVYDKIETISAGAAPEGTAVKSTGETGGSKFLREDGDGTCSWQAISGGGDALTTSPLSQFAATTSLQLKGVISDETGSGALVFATSPVLVTPNLGTPSALTLTNATGLPASALVASTSQAVGFGSINLGHASDTTIARVAAGRISVEGAELAKLASPTFTGTPAAPTASPGTNTTQVATTAFAAALGALKADLASPALTGSPTAPTQTQADNSTKIATTAYVDTLGATKAPLASPALTGTPTAPTAAKGTNTTQVATTAHVYDAFATIGINAQTGTAYTSVLTDAGKLITMDNGSANVFTVPANATVAYPVGTIMMVKQIGAGITTITFASGVTGNGASAGSAAIAARWTSGTLIKIATDTWTLDGNHAVVA